MPEPERSIKTTAHAVDEDNDQQGKFSAEGDFFLIHNDYSLFFL